MSKIIAIAGKGGVGKTAIAGLAVAALVRAGRGPVLAVDADPNSCLDAALGVRAATTVGKLREEARDESNAASTQGMSKRELLELKIAEGLVEAEDFDLIAMGRPEGPGCYCYANAVLKDIMAEIADNYPYVVLDNEAGLENLSRRLTSRADILILAADPSRRGLDTLARIYDLVREMGISYGKLVVIANRLRSGKLPPMFYTLREAVPADIFATLPEDDAIASFGEEGRSLMEIDEDNPVYLRVRDVLFALLRSA